MSLHKKNLVHNHGFSLEFHVKRECPLITQTYIIVKPLTSNVGKAPLLVNPEGISTKLDYMSLYERNFCA